MEKKCFFAVDLGATSGRTIIGALNNGKVELEELTRFDNNLIEVNGHFYWDIYALYYEIIKGLKKALSEMRRQSEKDKANMEKELRILRREHRELADLRELVFNQENEPSEEKVSDEIRYPYQTKKRTVVFGGHETWLKAFKPKFSNVRFVDASQYSFAPEVIRNADVVWIQNNRISHSQYYAVVNTARQYGIQVRYFPFASADKCAELLVREDRE